MCTNEEELYKRAEWNGKGSLSRQKLMDRLQCELLIFVTDKYVHVIYCENGKP